MMGVSNADIIGAYGRGCDRSRTLGKGCKMIILREKGVFNDGEEEERGC